MLTGKFVGSDADYDGTLSDYLGQTVTLVENELYSRISLVRDAGLGKAYNATFQDGAEWLVLECELTDIVMKEA